MGDSQARRLDVAMASAGLAAFGLLYATQAVLPAIGREFGVGPTATSLTVSAATGALAVSVLPLSVLADARGRVPVMRAALVVACVASLAAAVAPAFWVLLALRAVGGVALAGVVAVAVAHLGDEVRPGRLGAAVGVYVAGNSLGGIAGRLVPGLVEESTSWRVGIALMAVLAVAATVAFWLLLPPAERFRPRRADLGGQSRVVLDLLRDRTVRHLCGLAFVMMGGFVACYNYLTFRLEAPPLGLSTTVTSLLFLTYLAGTVSSPVAGRASDRFGRRALVLAGAATALGGLLLTLPDSLPWVVVGLVVLTAGFFAAHSVASSWVSQRAGASRGPAAALYLLAYYAGSSAFGALAGPVYTAFGWPGAVVVVGALFSTGGALAWRVTRWPADGDG